MTAYATCLFMQAYQTVLATGDGGGESVIPVGPLALAKAFFKHDPALPHELERAIDVIEEALMSTKAPRANGGALLTSDPILATILGQRAESGMVSRDQVESLF